MFRGIIRSMLRDFKLIRFSHVTQVVHITATRSVFGEIASHRQLEGIALTWLWHQTGLDVISQPFPLKFSHEPSVTGMMKCRTYGNNKSFFSLCVVVELKKKKKKTAYSCSQFIIRGAATALIGWFDQKLLVTIMLANGYCYVTDRDSTVEQWLVLSSQNKEVPVASQFGCLHVLQLLPHSYTDSIVLKCS